MNNLWLKFCGVRRPAHSGAIPKLVKHVHLQTFKLVPCLLVLFLAMLQNMITMECGVVPCAICGWFSFKAINAIGF